MKKDNIKLSIFWVFSFLVIIFMMTFTAHAASDHPLPFQSNFVGAYQSYFANNPVSLTTIEDYYANTISSNNYENYAIFIYEDTVNSSTIYLRSFLLTSDNVDYLVPYNEFNNTISIDDFDDFSKDYFVFNSTVRMKKWQIKKSDFSLSSGSSTLVQVSNFQLFGNHSVNNYGLTYCYPIYVHGSLSLDGKLVLASNVNVVDVGVAILPGQFFEPQYPSGSSGPSQVPPTFTSSDYTWTTPPSFDGSTVENAIGSLTNLVGWLSNNLKEEFKNLTDNLEGFFKYIGDTIQYYGNAIIETLNNGIQTFYNNMKSLVETISNQIEYIKEPLDQDVIWDNISTTSLVTNINTISTSLNSFQAAFTGVSEPSSYTIPIHLENLPSNWFGNQTTQYIDLGVINGTVKDGLRLFVWAMVTYGLVVTIFDSIANYINGGGDES